MVTYAVLDAIFRLKIWDERYCSYHHGIGDPARKIDKQSTTNNTENAQSGFVLV